MTEVIFLPSYDVDDLHTKLFWLRRVDSKADPVLYPGCFRLFWCLLKPPLFGFPEDEGVAREARLEA